MKKLLRQCSVENGLPPTPAPSPRQPTCVMTLMMINYPSFRTNTNLYYVDHSVLKIVLKMEAVYVRAVYQVILRSLSNCLRIWSCMTCVLVVNLQKLWCQI